MGTQDFPLHFPNHETTLNAKPILVFVHGRKTNVVNSATLKCHFRRIINPSNCAANASRQGIIEY
ncbi:hypothetical protein OCA8868_02464 [Octadecabacter ascidiaceicola]|uniref:Uncharacterized protein n=1 Tax=Octadecabacter ascidiaceicola TaxID=1655543 RepID=A0A238KEP0_9RHOB|nr:hypothetical protein OCA8868_02464 [Octadecabacter ascidiaceicola]